MDNTNSSSIGTISQSGNVMRADNALVEEVSTRNRRTGYILISYGVPAQNNMIQVELLRLNIGWDTIIINQFGDPVCLCDIRKGMRINAEFSSAMTRSIPPQATAFQIVVLGQNQEPFSNITVDRVVSVDTDNGFLYTGDPNDPSDQMRFVISNATVIMDRNGSRIPLRALRPGQLVRVEHATFQTPSIPPQTTAFRIQII